MQTIKCTEKFFFYMSIGYRLKVSHTCILCLRNILYNNMIEKKWTSKSVQDECGGQKGSRSALHGMVGVKKMYSGDHWSQEMQR